MSFIVQAPGETQTYSQILDKAVNGDHSSLLFISLNGTKTIQILAKFSIFASCAIKDKKKFIAVFVFLQFFAIFLSEWLSSVLHIQTGAKVIKLNFFITDDTTQ
jgi:hypothetical protein